MFHRGDRATARDLFDLALVIEREPEALACAAPFLLRYRERFIDQVLHPRAGLLAGFESIATPSYNPSFDHCVEVASEFMGGLKKKG